MNELRDKWGQQSMASCKIYENWATLYANKNTWESVYMVEHP